MKVKDYFNFVPGNERFVTFGFLMAFASSFGQTFFIGIFGPSVQQEFGLTHTAWGTIYMVGTLASALALPWTGKLIDRIDLRVYSVVICAFLILACTFMSFVANTTMLLVAIFLLRQSGQGLASHIAITSLARYFSVGRGRAIAIGAMGFATGEACLPILAVILVAAIGWRWTYGVVAAVLTLGLIPSVIWLLQGHGERHRIHMINISNPLASGGPVVVSWTLREVLRDKRFYLLMPGLLAPSVILTAMFFHHLNLADAKGWSHTWITGNYLVYALCVTAVSLICGQLIDRFSAIRLVRYMLPPLALSLFVVGSFDQHWVVWPYMLLAGVNVGIAHTAVAAMWAELYGVMHLGAIKSLASSLGVFGSALGPVIAGVLMDRGFSIEVVCLLFAGYAAVGAVLMNYALSWQPAANTMGRVGKKPPSKS